MVAPEPRSHDPLDGKRFALPLWPAMFVVFALFLGWLSTAAGELARRTRVPVALALAGFTVAVLMGCHHGNGSIVGPATTVGTTTMIVTGKAVDANGNSLNTSRPMPEIMLDVVAQPTGGGGFP